MADPDFPALANAESDIDASFDDTPVAESSTPCTAPRNASQPDWVEFVLLDDYDQPIGNEPYRLTLPDGSVLEGTLDAAGCVRVDGVSPGECEIVFPDLDNAPAPPAEEEEVAEPEES